MLELTVPEIHKDFYNEMTEEFIRIDTKEVKLQLEHSLISLKKWEQKWHKPFLGESDKTYDEMRDYIRCMSLNHGVDENVYKYLPVEFVDRVVEYIKDPMTATWFSNEQTMGAAKSKKEVITAEIIYYWMITLSIPAEFQKWHLNQLLTLIKVVSIKNSKPTKKDPKQAARERAALNAARRAKYNSNG